VVPGNFIRSDSRKLSTPSRLLLGLYAILAASCTSQAPERAAADLQGGVRGGDGRPIATTTVAITCDGGAVVNGRVTTDAAGFFGANLSAPIVGSVTCRFAVPDTIRPIIDQRVPVAFYAFGLPHPVQRIELAP
jgi:hypothetical protein